MAREIDNRVVQMSFDNKKFEQNAAESMSTLEKLNSLIGQFGKGPSSDGPSALSKAISGVGSATNVALGAIQGFGSVAGSIFKGIGGIVDTFIGAPLQKVEDIAKSLSLDQVNAGWEKYRDKTQAIQQVVSATAKDFTDLTTGIVDSEKQMEVVTGTVEKLNWFSDETSYSLIDMTSNLAKFTSAGVSLEKAETAMKGIALWAAKSGSNSQEASRAMYNLSQALGTGYVQAIDWSSITNAGMDTIEVKETLIQYGLEVGTLYKDAEGKIRTVNKDLEVTAENVRSTLTEGQWLTNEVLVATLNDYGRFTEELYTLTETTGATASDIMSMLDDYDASIANGEDFDLAGYAEELGLTTQELTQWIEELTSDENKLGRSAFRMAQESKTFEDAIEATKDAISTTWSSIFEKIFGTYDKARIVWTDFTNFLWDVFGAPIDAINEAMEVTDDLDIGSNILDFFYAIGDIGRSVVDIINEILSVFTTFTTTVRKKGGLEETVTVTQTWTEVLRNFLGVVSTGMKNAAESIGGFLHLVKDLRSGGKLSKQQIEEYEELLGEGFMSKGYKIASVISGIVKTFQGLLNAVKGIVKLVGNGRKKIWDSLVPDGSILDGLNRIFTKTGEVGDRLTELFDEINSDQFSLENYPVLSNLVTILTTIGKVIGGVVGGVVWLTSRLSDLVKIRIGKWNPLYTLEEMSGWASNAGAKAEDVFKPLTDGFKNLKNPFDFSSLADWFTGEKGFTSVGDVFDNLWARLRTAAQDSEFFQNTWENIKKIPGGIRTAFGNFGDWFVDIFKKIKEAVSNIDLKGFFDGDFGGFTAFFDKLGEAFNRFVSTASATDWVGLLNGIRKFLTLFTTGKTTLDSGQGIKNFGEGFNSFGEGISTLAGKIPSVDDIKDTLDALGESTQTFMGSLTKTIKAARGDTFAKSLQQIAKALLMIAAALFILSVIDSESMLTSLVSITIFLGVVAGIISAVSSMSEDGGEGFQKTAKAFTFIGAAVLLMAIAVRTLARLKPDALALGIVAMSAMIIGMAAAIKYLDGTDSLKAAGSMIMMALAIQMLTLAVVALALVPLILLAKGLGAAAIMMGMMTKALKGISGKDALGAAGAMIMISIAIDLLTASVLALSLIPLVLLAKGMIAVALMLAMMTTALKGISGKDALCAAVAMNLMSTAMLLMVPAIIALGMIKTDTLIQGLLGLAGVFVVLGVAAFAFQKLNLTLTLESLALSVLAIGAGMALAGVGILAFAAAMLILIPLAPLVVNAVKTVVIGIISLIPQIAIAIVEGIVSFATALTENIGILASALIECIVTIATTIAESATIIVESILIIIEAILKSLAEHLPQILEYGWEIIKTLAVGMWNALGEVLKALLDILKEAWDTIHGKIEEWKDLGRDLMKGWIEGIKEKARAVRDKVAGVGQGILETVEAILGIASPSKEFAWIGRMIDEGLIRGLQKESSSVNDAAAKIGEGALMSISDLASKADAILNDDISPTITPVLDLSNVEQGAQNLQSILGARRSMAIAGSISPSNPFDAEGPITATAMGTLVSDLKEAISQAKLSNTDNMSFDFYLDGSKLEAAVSRRQRQRAIATGR